MAGAMERAHIAGTDYRHRVGRTLPQCSWQPRPFCSAPGLAGAPRTRTRSKLFDRSGESLVCGWCAELGFKWPLTVGIGTLACDATGAILFRSGGVSYVVSGTRPDARELTPLRVPAPSPPPSNPPKRLPQTQRMDAFESMLRCQSRKPGGGACQRITLERYGLSQEEWALIDVEGHERKWPPLTRGAMPLDVLIAAGRPLCAPGSPP